MPPGAMRARVSPCGALFGGGLASRGRRANLVAGPTPQGMSSAWRNRTLAPAVEKPNPYYRKVRAAPRVVRILVGLALVVGGVLGFLPVLGFWMIPLGLVVIFFDVPWVRDRWIAVRRWWKERRSPPS